MPLNLIIAVSYPILCAYFIIFHNPNYHSIVSEISFFFGIFIIVYANAFMKLEYISIYERRNFSYTSKNDLLETVQKHWTKCSLIFFFLGFFVKILS